ncbi:MAG: O-unit flippase-like protein [Hyphomonadaceae bacterium]|nr:O-unit flippase-like protein [Hyphomonadaceae bacterium]
MRKGKDRRLDVLYAIVGTVMQVGTGVLMLPLIAATLSPSALTFWYVFLTIHTLSLLIEFGFTPTLARNFTYVLNGARTLRREGVPEGQGTGVDPVLLANLLRASRRLYTVLAAIVLVGLGVGGSVYLAALARTTTDTAHLWPAWGLFIASLALQTNFSWQNCLTLGADRLRENYQVAIVSRFVQVAASLAGLLAFPSILTLAAAYALSVAVARIHAGLVVRDLVKVADERRSTGAAAMAILRTLTPTAVRQGWVVLGEFFTNRFSLFAVSLAVGAAAAAEYAITLQVMMVLLTVSQIGTALSMPRLAAARLAGDMAKARDLYAFCVVMSVSLLAVGSAAFIALGEPILRMIGSETMLPPAPVLILLAVIYTVSVNAHTAMNVITTGNTVPHLRAVLITGAATTAGVIAVAVFKGDLFAFVAVQGVTQLAFNFWRWPIYAFRETGLTPKTLLPSAWAGAQRLIRRQG